MIALSVMFLLGVVVGTLQFVLRTGHRGFYHSYYSSKSLYLIDGLNQIARNSAQDRLTEIIEAKGDFVDISPNVVSAAESARLWETDDKFKPTVEVKVRVDPERLRVFAKESPYQSVVEATEMDHEIFKEGSEVEGVIEIEVGVQFNLGILSFRVPEKRIRTEHEFKRLIRVPRFLRHFALFVQDASTPDDEHEAYEGRTGYNRVSNTLKGESRDGALFLAPGGGGAGLPRADSNPFKDQVGYVYLGGDKPIYLNLTDGNDDSPYAENFQLFQSESSTFYKEWSTDYSNFVEHAQTAPSEDAAEAPKRGGLGGMIDSVVEFTKTAVNKMVDWFKNLFSNVKKLIEIFQKIDAMEFQSENMKSFSLPLYYVARRDRGYADRWKTLGQYGFTGKEVYSNNLHLYGVRNSRGFQIESVGGDTSFHSQGHSWGPTLVLGKVYSRCLSFAGLKQRRGAQNPSVGRQFEVQALPMEYFKDFDSLAQRLAYPKPGQDPNDPARPIWMWDARVDWSRDDPSRSERTKKTGENGEVVNGTWIPISGYALLGRLLPGMARFIEEEGRSKIKEIWEHTILPPAELVEQTDVEDIEAAGRASQTMNQIEDFPQRMKGGISPTLITLQKKGYFNRIDYNTLPWLAPDNSPYFEEFVRNYAYASYMTQEEMAGIMATANAYQNDDATGQAEGPEVSENDLKAVLYSGHTLWNNLRSFAQSSPNFRREFDTTSFPAKYADFWTYSGEKTSTDRGIFPFSLPDPWTKNNWANGQVPDHPRNFQTFFERAYGSEKDKIFDKYFRKIMTDPGRTRPYNYGMRFVYDELKQQFDLPPEVRAQRLASVAPEVRDGIGFKPAGAETYLDLENEATGEGIKFDHALDDGVLETILEKRKSDEYLQKGYYFMDDYGPKTKAPKDVDLDEFVRKGRRFAWENLTEDEFRLRFGPREAELAGPVATVTYGNAAPESQAPKVFFGSAAHVQGDFNLFAKGPVFVQGGGVLVVDGTVTLGGSLTSDRPLTIYAKRLVLQTGPEDVVKAFLVADTIDWKSGGVFEGAIACKKWSLGQRSPSGRALIRFQPSFKTDDTVLEIIEPKISKITVAGSGG